MTDLIYNYKNLIILYIYIYIYIHIFEKHNCIISLETKTNFLVTSFHIIVVFTKKKSAPAFDGMQMLFAYREAINAKR